MMFIFVIVFFYHVELILFIFFFLSSRRRHTRSYGDWSSDVCSSDLFGAQGCKWGGIRRARRPDDQVDRRQLGEGEHVTSENLSQSAAQTIAGHRGGLKSGNDDPHPRMARRVGPPSYVEMWGAPAATRLPAGCKLRTARQAGAARKPLARYRLRCLEGRRTVRRLRPFLRRRDSVARPHTVFIRARNPCLLMRRRLRGRYVGPIHSSV